MNRLICSFLFLLVSASLVHATLPSREQVRSTVLNDENFQTVLVKANAACKSSSGALLIKQGYAVEPSGYFNVNIKPLPRLAPFFIEFLDDQILSMSVGLYYGNVQDVTVLGIAPITDYEVEAQLLFKVVPNTIGKLLGNLSEMPYVITLKLFDDGWRFSGFKGKMTSTFYSDKLVKLYGFQPNAISSKLSESFKSEIGDTGSPSPSDSDVPPKTKQVAMAKNLVSKTLEKGRTNEEKVSNWNGAKLIGVTPTKTFKYLKYPCRNYNVVYYGASPPENKLTNGSACRVKGNWYPMQLIKNPRKKIPQNIYNKWLVGSGW